MYDSKLRFKIDQSKLGTGSGKTRKLNSYIGESEINIVNECPGSYIDYNQLLTTY